MNAKHTSKFLVPCSTFDILHGFDGYPYFLLSKCPFFPLNFITNKLSYSLSFRSPAMLAAPVNLFTMSSTVLECPTTREFPFCDLMTDTSESMLLYTWIFTPVAWLRGSAV